MVYGYGLQPPKALAEVLQQMSYGDLLDVAEALCDMNAGENEGLRDMKTKYGWADTLFDWSEATLEEIQEEEHKAAAAEAKAA